MTPFQRLSDRAEVIAATREELMAKSCDSCKGLFGGRTPTEAEKLALVEYLVQRVADAPRFHNNLYVVQIEELSPFLCLSVRRKDWAPCRDWRHFQQIKNELIGVEREAVDLFPAESRLLDISNTYHLWVHADPTFRFPVGLLHPVLTSTPFSGEDQGAEQEQSGGGPIAI